MADITYRVEGDHLIPELILDGEGYESSPEGEIGRYGELRECFLKEYRHGTYTAMLLMERQGVDEALKVSDQMMWVQKVNALRAMAEEVVFREIVYQ